MQASDFKIEKVERVPYEEDEEPGMPTFHVTASAPGFGTFVIKTSCEIDGRDCEHDLVKGRHKVAMALLDYDFVEFYFEALCMNEAFQALSQAAADEYFAK